MASKVGWAVASAALNTSAGNQSITVDCEGKTPKAAIFFLTSATALDTITAARIGCWGMTDGTTSRCLVNMSENNALTAIHDTGRRQAQDRVLITTTTSDETLDGDASFVSFGADTVTINVEDAFGSGWIAIVWAFYGDDLQVNLQDLTANAALNGTQALTGVGFTPNLAFAIGLPGGFAAAATANSRGSFGWAANVAGSIVQGNVAEFERDTPSVAAACGFAARDDSFASRFTVSGTGVVTDEGAYQLQSFDADGLTVKTINVGTACVLAVLSMKTGSQRVWTGYPSIGVNATGDKTVTSPGWPAGFLAGAGSLITTLNSINSGSQAIYWTIGAGRIGGTTRNASVYSEDAQNPSDSKSLLSSALLEAMNGGAATDWKVTIVKGDPLGFVVNVGTASSDDRQVLLLALEATPIIANDTEQISETLSFRRGESSLDTEQISDAPAFRRGESLSDTEQISDQVALRRGTSSGDSEQLLETVVIVRKESSSDSETIVESVYFRLPQTVGDTEQISDAAVLKASGGDIRVLSDTEEIADAFVTKLAAAGASVFSDVEDITEQVQLIQGFQRILSETEEISDVPVLKMFRNIFDVSETERISESVRLILGQVRVTSETLDILDSMNTGRGAVAMKATKAGKVF